MTVRESGAEDGARTRYLQLGKLSLYQMSYFRVYFLPNLHGKGNPGGQPAFFNRNNPGHFQFCLV